MKTIKVWDLETGSSIFEFGQAHEDTAITCLTFDATYKRYLMCPVCHCHGLYYECTVTILHISV